MARRHAISVIAGIFLITTVVTACGSDDSTSSATPTETANPVAGEGSTVDLTLQEFAIIATPSSVPAGSVTFTTTNTGPDDVHEVVIIKTDLALADLPIDKDGAAIEDAEGLDAIDEIEDLEVGDTQDLTVDLEAGSYVLVCNIVQTEPDGSLEAHFKMGMSTTFTVT